MKSNDVFLYPATEPGQFRSWFYCAHCLIVHCHIVVTPATILDFVRVMSCGHGKSRDDIVLLTEQQGIAMAATKYGQVREQQPEEKSA